MTAGMTIAGTRPTARSKSALHSTSKRELLDQRRQEATAPRNMANGPRTCARKCGGNELGRIGILGRNRHSASCSCRTSVAKMRMTSAATASVSHASVRTPRARSRCDAATRGRARSGRTTFHHDEQRFRQPPVRASPIQTGSSSGATIGMSQANSHGTASSARPSDVQSGFGDPSDELRMRHERPVRDSRAACAVMRQTAPARSVGAPERLGDIIVARQLYPSFAAVNDIVQTCRSRSPRAVSINSH